MKRINVFEFYTNEEMLSDEVRKEFIALVQQVVKQGYLAIVLRRVAKSDGCNLTFIFQNVKFLFDILDEARDDLKQQRIKIAKKILVDLFAEDLTEAKKWFIVASEFLSRSCYRVKFNTPVKVATASRHNLPLSSYSSKEKRVIFANLRKEFTLRASLFGGLLSKKKRLPVDNFVIYSIQGWEKRLDQVYKNNPFIFFTNQGIVFDR